MLNTDDDLHATAESIADDARRLMAIEEEKEHLGADDPRVVELSQKSQALARRLVPKTTAELELATEAQSGCGPAGLWPRKS